MLKQLIMIRLLGMFGTLIGDKGSKKSLSKGKKIVLTLLSLYCFTIFSTLSIKTFTPMLQPFQEIGYEWLYFGMLFIGAFGFCFVGSIFFTKQEIYEAKDNELLLSLPIKQGDILLSRVFSLCLLNYFYEGLIVIPCTVVYFMRTSFHIGKFLVFLAVFLTFPLFVLVITCFFAWLFEVIMQKLKLKSFFLYILYVGGMGIYIYGIFKITEYGNYLVQNGENIGEKIQKSLFPIYHLSIAIVECNVVSLLFYFLSCFIPFYILYSLLKMNFYGILMGNKVTTTKRKWKEEDIQMTSPSFALVKRKMIQIFSNPMIVLNGLQGSVMGIGLFIFIIIKREHFLEIGQKIPNGNQYIWIGVIALLLVVNVLNFVSAVGVSLEGDRLWILKTLPITEQEIIKGLYYLNLIVTGIPMLVIYVGYCILFPMTILQMTIALCFGICIFLFFTSCGLIFDLSYPKLQWTSEVSAIKHNYPLMFYFFAIMMLPFSMVLGYIFLSLSCSLNVEKYILICTAIFGIIGGIIYWILQKKGEQLFKNIQY